MGWCLTPFLRWFLLSQLLGLCAWRLLLHSASWFPPLGGSECPGRAQETQILALPLSNFLQWLWASVPLFVASLYPVPLLMGSPVLAIGRCQLGHPAQSLRFCPLVFDPWNPGPAHLGMVPDNWDRSLDRAHWDSQSHIHWRISGPPPPDPASLKFSLLHSPSYAHLPCWDDFP